MAVLAFPKIQLTPEPQRNPTPQGHLGDTLPLRLLERRAEAARQPVTAALEKLPHVTERVCLLWGAGEFETYVSRLLMDARDGKRQGLPWEAAEELLFLSELSMAKRALRAAEVTGEPFAVAYERCLANADRIGGTGAVSKGDPWSDPRASNEASRLAPVDAHGMSVEFFPAPSSGSRKR